MVGKLGTQREGHVEDAGRRRPSASSGERPQNEANLHLRLPASRTEEVSFCCLSPGLCFVLSAPVNSYSQGTLEEGNSPSPGAWGWGGNKVNMGPVSSLSHVNLKPSLRYLFIFIYLATPGLSCSMQDLQSLLQHENSVVACGNLVP